MGNSSFKNIILYRVDHDIDFDPKKNKTLLFTDLRGLFCNLMQSKHRDDSQIKIIEYVCDLNLYELFDNQKEMELSLFPEVDENYVQNIYKEFPFCKDFVNINYISLFGSKKKEKVENRHKKYGDIFILDINDSSFSGNITKATVYDLNIKKNTQNKDNFVNTDLDVEYIKSMLKKQENESNKHENDIKDNNTFAKIKQNYIDKLHFRHTDNTDVEIITLHKLLTNKDRFKKRIENLDYKYKIFKTEKRIENLDPSGGIPAPPVAIPAPPGADGQRKSKRKSTKKQKRKSTKKQQKKSKRL